MNVPNYLNEDGKQFWKRHVKQLPEGADLDAFGLLCNVYGHWRATDPTIDSRQAMKYSSLVKQLIPLMKIYGIMPNGKPVKPAPLPPKEQSEFDEL